MRRTIDGPEQDLLTREEVCRWLRISERQLRRFVEAGRFPRGIPYGERGPVLWQWEDVWAFRHLHGRLSAGAEEKDTSKVHEKRPP